MKNRKTRMDSCTCSILENQLLDEQICDDCMVYMIGEMILLLVFILSLKEASCNKNE
jgi:hypothetical protein